MIILKMLTEDEKKNALAHAYWSQKSDGSWEFTPEELAKRFSSTSSRLPSIVATACTAIHAELVCHRCPEHRLLTSRTHLSRLLNDKRLLKIRPDSAFLCVKCRKAERDAQKVEKIKQQEMADKKIANWRNENLENFHSKSYKNSPLLDAFFIDGLLGYAGDAWQGEQLASWAAYEPHLCAIDTDAIEVYQHLYLNGWIVPDARSPLDAIFVDEDGNVDFDFLRVRWLLAPDADGTPPNQILEITSAILFNAKSNAYLVLWQWTCLHELHAHFNYCKTKKRIDRLQWTQVIEQELAKVLEVHSLAQAKSIMYFCIDNLSNSLNDKKVAYLPAHNQLAGHLLLMSNRWHSSGRSIYVVPHRAPSGVEAIYTSHLFDIVLGGGDELYFNLTGKQLKSLSRV